MRTKEIFEALKKYGKRSAARGLITTTVAEGGLILYHNWGDYFGRASKPSANGTLEQCLDGWNQENMREFIQALVMLAIVFPATLLHLVYLAYSDRTPGNSNNEGLALVRDAQPRENSPLMKLLKFFAAALVGALSMDGLVGTPITLLTSMKTDLFQFYYPNSTAEQCNNNWQLEDQKDFFINIYLTILGLAFGAAGYALLSRRPRALQRLTPIALELPSESNRSEYSPTL